MARNDLGDTRFLFPDMFSCSFDPEILTFLWGICARRLEDVQPMLLPKSGLLQVFVPYEGQPTNFLTCLRYSVVTSGVIIVVGFSSYSTFRVLQKLRNHGFQGLKSLILALFTSLKQPARNLQAVRNLQLVIRRRINSKSNGDLRKRPSDLQLAVSTNGSNTSTTAIKSELNGNIVPVRSLSVTPINGDIASGDEDVEDVQSQYFGPMGADVITRIPVHGISNTPLSPESAFRARYESLRTPDTPS